MSRVNDPSLYGTSGYERRFQEKYYTEPWVTEALVEAVTIIRFYKTIWEPAAGRGDMGKVLANHAKVYMDDLTPDGPGIERCDFLQTTGCKADAIITNPPYNEAQAFVEHALSLQPRCVAMLLRSEFKHANGRRHLFGNCDHYYGEVVLTTRPRWDWWETEKPKASPRHNFSWFVWMPFYEPHESDMYPRAEAPLQFFIGKEDVT